MSFRYDAFHGQCRRRAGLNHLPIIIIFTGLSLSSRASDSPPNVKIELSGRSSNGKTADSGSAYRGSSPCLPATHSVGLPGFRRIRDFGFVAAVLRIVADPSGNRAGLRKPHGRLESDGRRHQPSPESSCGPSAPGRRQATPPSGSADFRRYGERTKTDGMQRGTGNRSAPEKSLKQDTILKPSA